MKKLANMKEGTFVQCLSSFQLKIKCKSQRVRDKAYKVVNLTSMCASIISMDISTAWPKPHIHTWIYNHGYIHGFIYGYPYPRQACTNPKMMRGISVVNGGGTAVAHSPPKKKKSGKYIWGKYILKLGHLKKIIMHIFSGNPPPPRVDWIELLRL